jgi:endonuclease III
MLKKIEKLNNSLRGYFGMPLKAETPPDPLDLLIATILSQNTNDKNSYAAFCNLKEKYPEWEGVLNTSDKKLEKVIKTAGLGGQKTAAIKNILKYLKEKRGVIDLNYLRDKENDDIMYELTSVKGIGVKTASCVLLFSLGRNVLPVDTHVHRVLNRVGLVKTAAPEKTFRALQGKIPQDKAHEFHTNLIRLGREICKPAVPVCFLCPIKQLCNYPAKDFVKKTQYKENNFFLLDNINTELNREKK